MRLGGPIFEEYENPDRWVQAVNALGYRAAFCPVGKDASPDEVESYVVAAREADIAIAEVGAWSNPLSPDPATRTAALEKCKSHLALADRVGAQCCVNISGSRGEKWDGPCPKDLTEETFEMIVASVREIIDDVQPTRTFYALETMPWMYPDSPESYLGLLKAIDRTQFAVHFDPVNLICSPQRYFDNASVIREFVSKLGEHIKSCHAKDILLQKHLTTHLDEVRPGAGKLDYRIFFREMSRLSDEIPLMLEHLPTAEEYQKGADHLRRIAREEGFRL